jgi:homoserine dehydrogenase
LWIADCGFDSEIQSAIRNPRSAMTDFDLLLVGYGNVARRFASLLAEQRSVLARDHGLRVRIVGIATRRHGQAYGTTAVAALRRRVDRAEAVGPAEAGHDLGHGQPATLAFLEDALRRSAAAARRGRLVVVETTTLDVARGEPAIAHVRAALAGGAHVITANKGPVAFAYRRLAREAERAHRRFLFEGAVMDGVPVFNLVRETLPAVRIEGFRGILNTTTNFILTAMERGQPFGDALAEMQARGIAEADASLDVDGWDAAAKTAALANVLLDARITPRMVDRQGIAPETARLALEARAAGRRLKLVARAHREGRRVVARVAPEPLPGDDLLAGVDGHQNALILQTDLLEEIALVQRGSGLTQTAYALLSDLIAVARDVSPASARRRSPAPARRGRIP